VRASVDDCLGWQTKACEPSAIPQHDCALVVLKALLLDEADSRLYNRFGGKTMRMAVLQPNDQVKRADLVATGRDSGRSLHRIAERPDAI
jgi:hypothetical protein